MNRSTDIMARQWAALPTCPAHLLPESTDSFTVPCACCGGPVPVARVLALAPAPIRCTAPACMVWAKGGRTVGNLSGDREGWADPMTTAHVVHHRPTDVGTVPTGQSLGTLLATDSAHDAHRFTGYCDGASWPLNDLAPSYRGTAGDHPSPITTPDGAPVFGTPTPGTATLADGAWRGEVPASVDTTDHAPGWGRMVAAMRDGMTAGVMWSPTARGGYGIVVKPLATPPIFTTTAADDDSPARRWVLARWERAGGSGARTGRMLARRVVVARDKAGAIAAAAAATGTGRDGWAAYPWETRPTARRAVGGRMTTTTAAGAVTVTGRWRWWEVLSHRLTTVTTAATAADAGAAAARSAREAGARIAARRERRRARAGK